MIRLLISVAFAFAVATSARAHGRVQVFGPARQGITHPLIAGTHDCWSDKRTPAVIKPMAWCREVRAKWHRAASRVCIWTISAQPEGCYQIGTALLGR